MAMVRNYENTSGQMVNLSKSYLYLHDKISPATAKRIRKITGLAQGNFLCKYLRCPVFYGRRKIIYFERLLRRVSNKIMS